MSKARDIYANKLKEEIQNESKKEFEKRSAEINQAYAEIKKEREME